MTAPVPQKSDVLNQLHDYENLAFRVALRRDPQGDWMLHTLVVDAIPDPYMDDETTFAKRYTLERFVHLYPTAAFIAGVQPSTTVISWFDAAHDISIPAPSDPGTSTRVVTTRMPVLQEQPSLQTYYYRTAQIDGYDRMLWPHTLYSFSPTPFITEQQDNSRLIAIEAGTRSFPNFKAALATLIYGEKDRDQAQRRLPSSAYLVRIVKEKPFLADIRLLENRHIVVDVQGSNMSGTIAQLDAANCDLVEQEISSPGTYRFEVGQDLPQSGQLTLIQGGELLDIYEWNYYNPLPGAPKIAPSRPAYPSPLDEIAYPFGYDNVVGDADTVATEPQDDPGDEVVPPAIRESLARFRQDHPDAQKTGFIMMRFASSDAHNAIVQTIKDVLASSELEAVRADDHEYHTDLFSNIETYMHGCGFGIAVFERLDSEEFNPNVALEVGYMYAMGKPVCLLKEKTLKTLHADIVGKLYRPFDTQHIQDTIPKELKKWLRDKSLLPDHT